MKALAETPDEFRVGNGAFGLMVAMNRSRVLFYLPIFFEDLHEHVDVRSINLSIGDRDLAIDQRWQPNDLPSENGLVGTIEFLALEGSAAQGIWTSNDDLRIELELVVSGQPRTINASLERTTTWWPITG